MEAEPGRDSYECRIVDLLDAEMSDGDSSIVSIKHQNAGMDEIDIFCIGVNAHR